jgi:hypothetical protein
VYHEHFPFGFIICTKTGNSYQEHALKKEGTLIMGEYETYGNQRFQTLFAELTDYEKRGVYILINGLPASPMQIVQAHSMREEGVYMRDYVLNDKGDIKELDFQDLKKTADN